MIQQYKGNRGIATPNAENNNKSNGEQMSNSSSDAKESDDNNTAESCNVFPKKDKGEDNNQTAGERKAIQHIKMKISKMGKIAIGKWWGSENKNLPYFFQGLNYQNLDPNDSDSHGISRVCKEIQLFSNRNLVNDFPMSAVFLMRTIIKHFLIYFEIMIKR